MRPLGNRILVDLIKEDRKGSVILPENYRETVSGEMLKGRVVDKGSKVGDRLNIGDIVIFESIYGREVTVEDNQRILDVGCLLAVELP